MPHLHDHCAFFPVLQYLMHMGYVHIGPHEPPKAHSLLVHNKWCSLIITAYMYDHCSSLHGIMEDEEHEGDHEGAVEFLPQGE